MMSPGHGDCGDEHRNYVLKTQKQKYKSVEQDGESGDKPTYLWSMDLTTKEAKTIQ